MLPNAPDILTPEFKRDLNAYLGRLPASAPMKSLADIIAYNSDPAHMQEAIKYGQTQLIASQATDLTDPAQLAAYTTNRANSRNNARTAIDNVLTQNSEAIMTPATTLTVVARAPVPAARGPRGLQLHDARSGRHRVQRHRHSEAKLLAFGYAYEQATKLRRPPAKEPEPVALRARQRVRRRRCACAPGETANADVAAPVGGTVPHAVAVARAGCLFGRSRRAGEGLLGVDDGERHLDGG